MAKKEYKNKYIRKTSDVRRVVSEQINIMREVQKNLDKSMPDVYKRTQLKISIAKSIAYLSNTALTSIRDGELEERIEAIEERMQNE